MIKIKKSTVKPLILQTTQAIWTTELLAEIHKYGTFSKLPDSIKKIVSTRYKHIEITSKLIPKEDTKCAFCESMPMESGYIEIEHYLPKSIYPNETYEWTNLLPSCKRCNMKKLAFDTGKLPIVKPDVDDPELFFTYDSIKLIVKKNALDKTIAKRTIQRLDLNEFRLVKPRSELLVSLVGYENGLEQALEELDKSKSTKKINRLKSNILESLDQLKSLEEEKSKYAGFCRDYIKKSAIINLAKSKIT